MDFTKALNRFQAISCGPMCGFYRSKRPVYGLTLYLFASLKSGSKNTFNICRPNTGESFYTMDAFDLRDRYEKVDPEDARNGWTKLYEDLYHSCMHGKNCSAGKNCTAGRRLTRCSILGGSVVSLWGTLEGKEKKVNFYAWWCISFKKKRQSDVGSKLCKSIHSNSDLLEVSRNLNLIRFLFLFLVLALSQSFWIVISTNSAKVIDRCDAFKWN